METADTPSVGDRLNGRYLLLEVIGRATQAIVFRAHDERLQEEVVCRVALDALDRDGFRAQYHQLRSRSRALVRAFAYDEYGHDHRPFIVLESFPSASDFYSWMSDAPIAELMEMLACLADALNELHAVGQFHGDVHALNILVVDRGIVLIDPDSDYSSGAGHRQANPNKKGATLDVRHFDALVADVLGDAGFPGEHLSFAGPSLTGRAIRLRELARSARTLSFASLDAIGRIYESKLASDRVKYLSYLGVRHEALLMLRDKLLMAITAIGQGLTIIGGVGALEAELDREKESAERPWSRLINITVGIKSLAGDHALFSVESPVAEFERPWPREYFYFGQDDASVAKGSAMVYRNHEVTWEENFDVTAGESAGVLRPMIRMNSDKYPVPVEVVDSLIRDMVIALIMGDSGGLKSRGAGRF